MSKLDSISTQVSFHGKDLLNTIEKNKLVYDAVWKVAKEHLNATITVHVSPRTEGYGSTEWSMSVASPTGRKTFRVFQHTPNSSVSFTQG